MLDIQLLQTLDRLGADIAVLPSGGGMLYDLEYLQNDRGIRVAAFGSSAVHILVNTSSAMADNRQGYCGAALAPLGVSHHPPPIRLCLPE